LSPFTSAIAFHSVVLFWKSSIPRGTRGKTLPTIYLPAGSVLTGDTLFLDGVGRPDLEARSGEAEERSRALYRSLQRLFKLPEETQVLPGHAGVPLAFDGVPWAAALREVRTKVPLFQLDEAAFVRFESLFGGQDTANCGAGAASGTQGYNLFHCWPSLWIGVALRIEAPPIAGDLFRYNRKVWRCPW
jgi:hypothetical protein